MSLTIQAYLSRHYSALEELCDMARVTAQDGPVLDQLVSLGQHKVNSSGLSVYPKAVLDLHFKSA